MPRKKFPLQIFKRKYTCNPTGYELNDPTEEERWRKRFQQLERQCFKPNHERGSVVYDVLDDQRTFNQIATCMRLDDPTTRGRGGYRVNSANPSEVNMVHETMTGKDEHGNYLCLHFEEPPIEVQENVEEEEEEKESEIPPADLAVSDEDAPVEEEVVEESESEHEIEASEESEQSLHRSSSELSMLVEPPLEYELEPEPSETEYTNLYTNFLSQPDDKAATWRPHTETVVADVYKPEPHMTLLEKSGIITHKITREFCAWIRDLGGDDKTKITEEVLDELFSIEFNKPAARSLMNRPREVPTLTTFMAKARGFDEADFIQWTHQEIRSDVAASRRRPHRIAFGIGLRYPDRKDHTKCNIHHNWKDYKPPKELSSFGLVFEGQLHLKSTTGFCSFLRRNPQLRRPQYLVKMGMFDNARYGRKGKLLKYLSSDMSTIDDDDFESYSGSDLTDGESINMSRIRLGSRLRFGSRLGTRKLSFFISSEG